MEIPEGTRKRSRSSDGSGGSSAGGLDRLSALPDCLLHIIMSSLKARQVVQTCVLSTRWRHLWRSDSAIQGWEYSGRQAAAWLRRVMKYCTPGPGHAISSQRQGLNLSTNSWRLRRLHLCHVPLDDRFAEHLSSACCSLEDLDLDHCTFEIRSITSDSLKNLVLRSCRLGGFLSDTASPTLKTLVIDGSSNFYDSFNFYGKRMLAISAPMVAYLHQDVDGVSFRGGISINEMPSLDRASIQLRSHKDSFLSKLMCGSKLGGDQSQLLRGLSNVTSLELLDVGTTVLSKKPTFLEFQNLRNLLLGDCDLSDDFHLLRFFHRGSPNLEKVTLRHCKFSGDYEDKEGMHKLDRTSSSGWCYGLDFLRDANVELEVIHKDGDACQSAGELVRHLPNLKCTTDAVPDAAATTEDSMPHSTGVGLRWGTRCRMTSVRISGPEWE